MLAVSGAGHSCQGSSLSATQNAMEPVPIHPTPNMLHAETAAAIRLLLEASCHGSMPAMDCECAVDLAA